MGYLNKDGKYLVSNGKVLKTKTTISANPELDGTEEALTGLQLNGVNYGISLYEHNVEVRDDTTSNYYRLIFKIYNNTKTPFNKTTLQDYLKKYNQEWYAVQPLGYKKDSNGVFYRPICFYWHIATAYFQLQILSNDNNLTQERYYYWDNVYDKVTKIL